MPWQAVFFSLIFLPFLPVYALSSPALAKRDAVSDNGLSSAEWIWFSDAETTALIGSVAFIKTFTTPVSKAARSAQIAIAVDNNFTLWVNGQAIGATNDNGPNGWQSAQLLSAALNSSANVFSVLAYNTPVDPPGAADPAGLLAAIRIFYADGSNDTILSNSSWLVSDTVPADFPNPTDVSGFVAANVATKYGGGPWGTSLTVQAPDLTAENLTGSSWIWSTANASTNAPAETVGFRKTIATPPDKTPSSVSILVAADNTFQLFIDGVLVAQPPFDDNAPNSVASWDYAQRVTANLTAGAPSTVFTVLATNFPSQQTGGTSSAGFVALLRVAYTDGTTSDLVRTDATWLAGPAGVAAAAFFSQPDAALAPAVVQGTYPMAPWGEINVADVLDLRRLGDDTAVGQSIGSESSSASGGLQAPTSALPAGPTQTGGNAAVRFRYSGGMNLGLLLAIAIFTL